MRTALSAPLARRLAAAAVLGSVLALGGCVGAPETVAAPPGYGSMCFAGVYSCQLGTAAPVGSQCTCPGIGAPSFGAVR